MCTGETTIALLAVEGCMASSVRTAAEILAYANRGGTGAALRLVVASADGKARRAFGGELVAADCATSDLGGPAPRGVPPARGVAAIVIPAILGPLDALVADARIAGEVRRLADEGCVVAATCDDVFLLAASGLLDGRSAPVHPSLRGDFRSRFPAVRIDEDAERSFEGGILCSVGSASFADLMIETLRSTAGAAAADRCALVFLDRTGAAGAAPPSWTTAAAGPASRAAALMEARFSERLDVAAVARAVGATERTLARAFRRSYGTSPAAYLRARRCAAAAALLSKSDLAVEEISWRVGYADPSAFARTFRSYSGCSPAEYRTAQRRR